MFWIILFLCMRLSYTSDIKCNHPQCVDFDDEGNGMHSFSVEGFNISIERKAGEWSFDGFFLDCSGGQVLDSPALPQFTEKLQVSSIELNDCPLPATNILDAIVKFNISFVPDQNELAFAIVHLKSAPSLTASKLVGLNDLTLLAIDASKSKNTPEPGYLAGFPKLRSVLLSNLNITPKELRNLPESVDWLKIIDKEFDTLPNTISKVILAKPGLRNLIVFHSENPYSSYTHQIITDLRDLQSKATNGSLTIQVDDWKEKKLTPFVYCDRMKYFQMNYPRIEELPEGWVKACNQLEYLNINRAENLKEVPEKLLDGANALKYLKITASLQSIPAVFLESAPNLIDLDLSVNKLKTLASNFFSYTPSLQTLSLEKNKLDNSQLQVFSGLFSLKKLRLGNNEIKGDICNDKDYQPLRQLYRLRDLDVNWNRVQICSDWMKSFQQLDRLN